jgi:hypothetical protein
MLNLSFAFAYPATCELSPVLVGLIAAMIVRRPPFNFIHRCRLIFARCSH